MIRLNISTITFYTVSDIWLPSLVPALMTNFEDLQKRLTHQESAATTCKATIDVREWLMYCLIKQNVSYFDSENW